MKRNIINKKVLFLVLILLVTAVNQIEISATEKGTEIVTNEQEDEVKFSDPNLQKILNKIIDGTRDEMSPITRSEMETITLINNSAMNNIHVNDLTGLEAAVNLDYLSINAQGLTDVSPLANLEKLEYLSIIDSSVSDLSSLKLNPNLKTLNISPRYSYTYSLGSSPVSELMMKQLSKLRNYFLI